MKKYILLHKESSSSYYKKRGGEDNIIEKKINLGDILIQILIKFII